MEDDFDPPFDFQASVGAAAGSRMEISPGNGGSDESKTINVDERPFWLVEYFLYGHLKTPGIFSHYGNNIVQISVWIEALADAQAYLNQLNDPSLAGESWSHRGYSELACEFNSRPDATLGGFKRFVGQLNEKAMLWSFSYKNVFIFGI